MTTIPEQSRRDNPTKMKIAVTIGIYNEEKNIRTLIKRLLRQTRRPDEIIVVDDGSQDQTRTIIEKYAKKYPFIKYYFQQNKGPAAARNRAWKNSSCDICIVTDGDCVPKKDWLERLTKPLLNGKNKKIGACAGFYKTLNKKNILARFVDLEYRYIYRKKMKYVNVHGTYSLAVRKNILEKFQGFDENYQKPSGEDFDLCLKIAKNYKIRLLKKAIVGHRQPEKIFKYLRTQVRRAYDRMRIFRDHKIYKDSYMDTFIKYEIIASGLLLPSLIFFHPYFRQSNNNLILNYLFLIPIFFLLIVIFSVIRKLPFFIKKGDLKVALFSIPIIFLRNIAWFIGLIAGLIKFGLWKKTKP